MTGSMRRRAPLIVVFLKHKLISCDVIVPVMLELRTASPATQVRFVAPDRDTAEVIRRNVVLADAIDAVGQLAALPEPRGPGRRALVAHRMRMAWWSVPLVVGCLLGRVTLVHFGALNRRPLRWLVGLSRRATFLCQGALWSGTEVSNAASHLRSPKAVERHAPVGDALVAFQPDWPLLADPAFAAAPRYVFGSSRARKHWLDWVDDRAPRYLSSLTEHGIEPGDPILVYILSFLGELPHMRSPASMIELLHDTIDVLLAEGDGAGVVLKPHAITDMAVVRAAVDARRGSPIAISHLHPQVLATRASLVVASSWSTTFVDFTDTDIPTIEFTDYSDAALALTDGGSLEPQHLTHFVNRDREAFGVLVRELATAPVERRRPTGEVGDPSGLLGALARGEAT